MIADYGDTLGRLPLTRVAERCREESARYLQRAQSDPRFCFELFRRAFLDNDQAAWEAVYRQYAHTTSIVRHWVLHHPSFQIASEDADAVVNGAFFRMWKALSRDRDKFEAMRNLGALLRYLKLCVDSEIKDRPGARHDDDYELTDGFEVGDGHATNANIEETELWQQIQVRLNDDRERTAVYARFVLGMKPNDIYTQHPELYATVREVYAVLQNVLRRLRRDGELLQEYAQNGRI